MLEFAVTSWTWMAFSNRSARTVCVVKVALEKP
jgi:hypothetical protein